MRRKIVGHPPSSSIILRDSLYLNVSMAEHTGCVRPPSSSGWGRFDSCFCHDDNNQKMKGGKK